MTPHSVQAVAVHSPKRDTWTLRGWQRASPPQINRNTCGLWKWGFLCYCFTKWPLQSPDVILFNIPHPLPPATHTKHMQTDTTLPSPSAVVRVCTHTHTSVVCRTDGGLVEVLSVLYVCLVHSQLTGSPMSTPSCHHSTSHGSPDTPVST